MEKTQTKGEQIWNARRRQVTQRYGHKFCSVFEKVGSPFDINFGYLLFYFKK